MQNTFLRFLLLISLLLFFFPVHTQTNETDVKKWKSGKLSQEDFKGQNTFKGIPSKDSIRLEITNGKEKYNGITYKYYKVENLFDRKNSYITDSANINAIRFAQLNYDLLEVYRRFIQQQLFAGNYNMIADYKYVLDDFEKQKKIIDEETKNGLNENRLEEWELYVNKALVENPEPVLQKTFKRKFNVSVYLGGSYIIPTGDIGKLYNAAPCLNLGFELGWQRIYLMFDYNIGNATPKEDILLLYGGSNKIWERGKNLQYLNGMFSLAYEIYSTPRFALIPFVGYNGSTYSKKYKNEDKYMILKNESNSWNAGLCFDFRFKNIYNFRAAQSFILRNAGGENDIYSIRTKIFITGTNYKSDINIGGSQIGISLALHINAGILKR